MATDYPSDYQWYVLAYYKSGIARTKYKGDSFTEARSALQKARVAKNVDVVHVFKDGRRLGK